MDSKELVKELPKGIICWYDFDKYSDVLLVTNNNIEALVDVLCDKTCNVDILTNINLEINLEKVYDYIVIINMLESINKPDLFLNSLKNNIKENGHILIAVDNRLGARYFCGDRDPYTGRNFDGIENYLRVSALDWKTINGRCYSKAEIDEILKKAGMNEVKYYSVFPNINEAQLVYADGYMPEENLNTRFFPSYNYPKSVFLEEEFLYEDLIKNNMFHQMANSYFIEYSPKGNFNNIIHATMSIDRGEKNAMITIIRGNKTAEYVEKKPVYKSGIDKINNLKDNFEDLAKHGINMVPSRIENESFTMPYIKAMTVLDYMRDVAFKDKGHFISLVDRFKECILQSSEHLTEDLNDGMGIILKRGYMDLVPLNCFYIEDKDEFLFFDQELYMENCYANAIIFRLVHLLYWKFENQLERIIPKQFFFDRYNLTKNLRLWEKKDEEFIAGLRNWRELRSYNELHQPNGGIVSTNRQKINYSINDYNKIFVDIFKDIDNKKIILFGCGRFTQRFLLQFRNEYNIYAIVDNNKEKWGTELEGIKITSPNILKEVPETQRHIIICIKNYLGTICQLSNMGIEDYHIYNPDVEYPRKLRKEIENKNNNRKPYHIGYVAGVFDLFHIGHLNMFKRAKEQCDYLIVGVVSDDGVRIRKGTEPFVPFEERIEIVRSCMYVDEAVEIPYNYSGTRAAWQLYHFDVQFSGSDYEHNPDWLAEKEFLEKHGSTMVFFPYTQSTSSTKLKKAINDRIDNKL